MSNRSLRNRSSRYSSPAVFAPTNGDATPPAQDTLDSSKSLTEKNRKQQQTRLDAWVEPALRHAVPSFEDTKGLERLGVLEYMQPLGVPPTQKLLQKLKVPVSRTSLSARATPVQGESVESPSIEPVSAAETASPIIESDLNLNDTALATAGLASSSSPDTAQPTPTISSPLRPESESYPTQQHLIDSRQPHAVSVLPAMSLKLSAPQQVITSPPRGRPAKRDVEEMKVYANPEDPTLNPPFLQSNTTPRQPRSSQKQSYGADGAQVHDRFRGYLTNAINRAYRENNPELAAGLRKVMDESGRDEVYTALDNMAKYKQGVRLEQFKVFKRYIKKGIKEHRRSTSTSTPPVDMQGFAVSPSSAQPVAYVSSFHSKTKRPLSGDQSQIHNHHEAQPPTQHQATDNHAAAWADHSGQFSNPRYSASESDQIELATDLRTNHQKLLSPKRERESSFSSLSSALSHPEDIYPEPKPGSLRLGPENQPTTTLVRRQGPIRQISTRETRSSDMDNNFSRSRLRSDDELALIDEVTPKVFNVNADGPTEGGRRSKKNKFHIQPLSRAEAAAIEQKRLEFDAGTVADYNYRRVEETSLRSDVDELRLKRPVTVSAPSAGPPPPVIHRNTLVQSDYVASSPTTPATSTFPAVKSSNRKRKLDEVNVDGGDEDEDDESLSPPPESLSSPAPPTRSARRSVAPASSRASTPRVLRGSQPPAKRPRTMISPRKKRTGAIYSNGGRAGQGREATNANGLESTEAIDNDDQCYACGAEGELILCDGCPNSFHGDCLDPQVDPEKIEGSWYCPDCERKQDDIVLGHGLLGPLIDHIAKTSPHAFALPVDVQTYFEGVKAGDEGEYVELLPPMAHKKGQRNDNGGNIRAPDYKAERDNKGNVRLCYRCGLSTCGVRDIIPCDYCVNEWHYDCLPIPAAGPVKRFRNDGQATKPWRCPLHVNDDLGGTATLAGVCIGEMGRQPRIRKPRGNIFTEPVIPRRFANNGIVDILLEPEDPDINVKTIEMRGESVRVGEQSVKLDFIAKARLEFYNDITIQQANAMLPAKFHSKYWTPDAFSDQRSSSVSVDYTHQATALEQAAIVRLRNKPLSEQQAILSLQSMAERERLPSNVDSSYKISDLIDQLVSDAPTEVADQIADTEEEQLKFFVRLAEQRLAIVRGGQISAKTLPSTMNGTTSLEFKLTYESAP